MRTILKDKKLAKLKEAFMPIVEALTAKTNEIHWLPSVLVVKMRDISHQ